MNRLPSLHSVDLRCLTILVILWIAGFHSPEQRSAQGQPPDATAPAARLIQPPAAKRWWKGNLHTHTFWSDGNDFPEMVADWYRQHDYNFLALSDHNILSSGQRWMDEKTVKRRGGPDVIEKYLKRFGPHWVELRSIEQGAQEDGEGTEMRLKPLDEFRALVERSGEFIMIQGEEISDSVAGAPLHLNATNLAHLLQPLGGPTVTAAIEANLRAAEDQAHRDGREILVHLNHPNFGWAITAEDLAQAVTERYFEVYNGHPDVGHLGDTQHPPVERLWDIANTLRIAELGEEPLLGIATDDSHNYHDQTGSISGRGWVMVRAYYLTPEHLIRAIRAGDFYASSGVELQDVRFDAGSQTYHVEIAAREGQSYVTEFIGTRADFNRSRTPRVSADDGSRRLTLQYSSDIGTVLERVEGATASYQFRGDELYVRAVVTSSEAHPRPSFAEQHQQAWTQPAVRRSNTR